MEGTERDMMRWNERETVERDRREEGRRWKRVG
jgi:hypothetical protein